MIARVVLYAEGANFRIDLDDGVARSTVWKRPDLTFEQGARCAQEKIASFGTLAASATTRGMIFDLSEAPPVMGPKTLAAVGEMLTVFETAGKPIAVIIGDNSTQKLQITRLVTDHATTRGRVFARDARADADAWMRTPRSPSGPHSRPR